MHEERLFIHYNFIQVQCGDEAGWGRKKKREVKEDVAFEDLNVGTSMSVGTDIDLTPTGKPVSFRYCNFIQCTHVEEGVFYVFSL